MSSLYFYILKILRERTKGEFVVLKCVDLPFISNRNFNELFVDENGMEFF